MQPVLSRDAPRRPQRPSPGPHQLALRVCRRPQPDCPGRPPIHHRARDRSTEPVAGLPHRACRDRNRNPRSHLLWVRRRSAPDCPRQPLADRSAQDRSADPTRDASPRRPFPHRNRCALRLRMNCPVPSVTSCFGVQADFLLPSQNLAKRVAYSRHGLGLRFLFTTALHLPLLAVLRCWSVCSAPASASPGSAFAAKRQGSREHHVFFSSVPPST
jgi:hypothetical protein